MKIKKKKKKKKKTNKQTNKTHLIWIEFITPYSVLDLILGSKNLCGGGEQQHLVQKLPKVVFFFPVKFFLNF
jgi:hypothetical protein